MKNTRHNTFFTSDLHFGHANAIRFNKRPFRDLEHMEETMIKRWNAKVKPEDKVIVVGDFSLGCGKPRLREILSQLNGTKILVKGNHDYTNAEMVTAGFDFSCDFMQIKIANELVSISHYPFKASKAKNFMYKILHKLFPKKFYKPRFFAFQKPNDGGFLIHGHTHDKLKVNGKQIHVGVDAWGFEPIASQKIAEIIAQVNLGIYQENGKVKKRSWWKRLKAWRG
jgi:calcineurin-like phosphoesterase family protein